MQALTRALESGNLEAAMAAIPWKDTGDAALRAAYQEILGDAYAQAGEATAEALRGELGIMEIRFNLTNPRAEAWAENVGATRVVEISDETVAAIRSVISRGFDEGRHPRQTASLLMGTKNEDGYYRDGVIGLTEAQANAVYSYRSELENDEIERSTETEDRMVARYASELLRDRAENIARTETLKASNEGQQALWEQAKDEGFLRGDERRIWIITPDDRLCEECLAMGESYGDGTAGVGLYEEFETDEGDTLLTPPLHPRCRCSVGLINPHELPEPEEEV